MNHAELPNENLRLLLATAGCSVARVAQDVGIHPSVLSRYVNGKNRPAGANAAKLAERFGVTLEQIRDEAELSFTDATRVSELPG